MAADVPFGLSFGDPRRYMGSSPLAEIGKAAKTGLMLYGLQQSGAIAALDKLGVKPNQAGTFSYSNPIGPTGAVPPSGAAMQPVVPNAPTFSTPLPLPAVATPVYDSAPMSTTPPANIGVDVLDGKYNGAEQSFVNPQAQRDFNPFVPQTTPNPVALTGNEYQQLPGYGKLAKAFQGMAGGMFG
jgi:hypothetical protein